MTDKVVSICLLGSFLNFVHRSVHTGNADVIINGLAEQLNVLRHIRYCAADRIIGVFSQIHTVQVDLAIFRLIILEQKLGDRGFAAAAAAHQRDLFTGRNGKLM